MNKIELVQKIGNHVCEECGSGSDCGIDPTECSRIEGAINLLDQYASQQINAADEEGRAVLEGVAYKVNDIDAETISLTRC